MRTQCPGSGGASSRGLGHVGDLCVGAKQRAILSFARPRPQHSYTHSLVTLRTLGGPASATGGGGIQGQGSTSTPASTAASQAATTEAVRHAGSSAQDLQGTEALTRVRRRVSAQDAAPRSRPPALLEQGSGGIPAVAVGVAALAGVGVLAVLYQKFFAGVTASATSAIGTLPQAVTQVGFDFRARQRWCKCKCLPPQCIHAAWVGGAMPLKPRVRRPHLQLAMLQLRHRCMAICHML